MENSIIKDFKMYCDIVSNFNNDNISKIAA